MEETKDSPVEVTDKPAVATKKKSGGCLKGCLIAFVLVLLITGGGLFAGWKFLQSKLAALTPPQETTIQVDSGSIQKQTAGQFTTVTSGQTLTDGDTVKTGPGSQGTITFPNGSEMRLNENSTVTISQTSQTATSVMQTAGQTWSRVTKLLGKNETYEVETPTALATVRGTAFATTITDGDTHVDTEQSEVEVAAIERIGRERRIINKLAVDQGNGTWVRRTDIAEIKAGRKKLIKEATKEDIKNSGWFKNNRERDKKVVDKSRQAGLNPLGILSMFRSISPDDLLKLKALVEKVKSGNINLTQSQQSQLEGIANQLQSGQLPDPSVGAQALAIVDPQNFSDTAHWTQVLTNIFPLIKSGKLPLLQK